MQIQTIEEKTGLDRATIRYYEQEGLITPNRLQNGYRDYSDKQLQDLMKIKLLRQLGLPLEKIQQLIEGKGSLEQAITEQIPVLKANKDRIDDAESICQMILADKVTFASIQPNKYFNALEKKQIGDGRIIDASKSDDQAHIDYVYLESHPIRRFVGRNLDHFLLTAILMLLIIAVFRVRPFGSLESNILSIAAILLVMPINALFLTLFGTTPGKFAVGIFIKTPEGKNLSFMSALKREWSVFRYGLGFNIPVYTWIRLYKSYQIHTEGRELEWDYEHNADVLYTQWDAKRWITSVTLGVLCAITVLYTSQAAMFPKYQAKDLTLAQFAENYNDYAKREGLESLLSEEGEWYSYRSGPSMTGTSVQIDVFNITEYWEFITDENQYLSEIRIISYSDSRLFFLGTGKKMNAIVTAIMSQPGARIATADDAINELSELTFITDLKEVHYDFDGVTVDLNLEDADYNSNKQPKLTVIIKFPE